jgi:hypothetical protein
VEGAEEVGNRGTDRERIRELRAEVLRRTMQLLYAILATPSPTPSPTPFTPSALSHAPAPLSEGQIAVREMLLTEGLLSKDFFSLVNTASTISALSSL